MKHIPELDQSVHGRGVRVPPGTSVALTRRTLGVVDHPAFQRLRRIRQLGPTHLVYPGAVHTRFEHSIGVFSATVDMLNHLLADESFSSSATEADLLTVLAAALLHDLGHYSMAHSLEALHLKGNDTPRHEDVAASIVFGEIPQWAGTQTIATVLARDWGVDPHRVVGLFLEKPRAHESAMDRLLASIISGAVDADKMDYLARDSWHMGVAYGRSFDRARLLSSLTIDPGTDTLGVTSKGRMSAELFVFCRYAMFGEAYWHHTVRSVSAMVEAALSDLQAAGCMPADRAQLTSELLRHNDDQFFDWLQSLAPQGSAAAFLLSGLAVGRRRLHKRILTLSRASTDEQRTRAYNATMALDADGIRERTAMARQRLSSAFGLQVGQGELIIDTPPRDKDQLEDITIVPDRPGVPGRTLREASTVVQGIAADFIGVVKKTRVFVAPHLTDIINQRERAEEILIDLLVSPES